MADLNASQMRIMLHSYEQQLLAARRLARFRVRKRLEEGLNPRDPDPSLKRRDYVEKVARELYSNLIFTGSANPVVEDIRKELGRELGNKEVEFSYPPGGELCILIRETEGLRPLSDEEQMLTRQVLERITSQKVDQSMLKKPPRTGGCC